LTTTDLCIFALITCPISLPCTIAAQSAHEQGRVTMAASRWLPFQAITPEDSQAG
jgi:hypothetical protein